MQRWAAWGILGIFACQDLRTRELSFPMLLAGFILGGVSFVLEHGWNPLAAAGCLGTGGMVLLLSHASKGAVGSGDGWVLMDVGWLLGAQEVFSLLIFGLLLSSLWAAGRFVRSRGARRQTIAFVPFLWLAETGILLL